MSRIFDNLYIYIYMQNNHFFPINIVGWLGWELWDKGEDEVG